MKSATKWLLSVTFLLSMFSFSNYVGHASAERAVNPIELVSHFGSKTGKQTIAYQKAAAQWGNNTGPHVFTSCAIGLQMAYDRLNKVKFDSHSDQTYITLLPGILYHHKKIPQNEEIPPSAFPLG
ncbi:hypothetical protein WIW50_05105 [Flavobacteriaceae bacterium 3-367]